MDFVIHQVVQFEHVHVAHCHWPGKRFAGTTVEQLQLAGFRQIGEAQHRLDLGLFCTVEYGGGHRHTAAKVSPELENFGIGQIIQGNLFTTAAHLVVDLVQEFPQLLSIALNVQHAPDLEPQSLGRKTQMCLEHLTDVHARGNPQGVENDVHRRTIGHVGHVFDRNDLRDDTLVSVTPGHLVARLDAPLDGQKHLDHLQHARREIISSRNLATLFLETLIECLTLQTQLLGHAFQAAVRLFVLKSDLEPLLADQFVQICLLDDTALAQPLGTTVRRLADQQSPHALIGIVLEDSQLIVKILADRRQFGLFGRQRPLILLDPVTSKHMNVDDMTVHAGRDTQRGIFHIGGFLTKYGAQQLFLRCQLGFALGRHLPNQNIARLDLGADERNAGWVEFGQGRLTDIGNIGGDFFRPELGIPCHAGQLFDVNGCEAIFLDQPL